MHFFDEFLSYLKTKDPELKDEIIKPILSNMLKETTLDFSVDEWINHIIEQVSEFPIIKLEIENLKHTIEKQKEAYLIEHTDVQYRQVLRGKLKPEEQYYRRNIHIYPNESFAIYWSIEKANNIIKNKSKKKEYVNIKSMNIDVNELDYNHLKKAVHNKKPVILVEYEALNEPYCRFLIDGNHRAFSNYNRKETYPTYILNSEEQMSAMIHPFFQYHYLLHVLFKLLKEFKGHAESIILDKTSRYNVLKSYIQTI